MTQFPPGPKGDPLLGCARYFMRDTLGFLTQVSRDYGDLVYLKAAHKHIYLLNHPHLIQQVLVQEAHKIRKGPALRRNTYPAFGDGLLTSEGAFHDRQRRLIQPAFHTTRVNAYFDVMLDETQKLLDTWQAGTTRDIHADMTALTMQIVARALFGADLSTLAGELGAAIGQGMEILGRRIAKPPALRLPGIIPTRENRLRKQILALLNGTIYALIEERRLNPQDRGDLLSMLLLARDQDGAAMSDKQIRDEVMTIFLAGHETTANALAWALYLIAQHPQVEARLHAEVRQVIGDQAPTLDHLPRLTYTDMIFREALRLYPPAWATSRQTLEPLQLGGYDIPTGSTLVISPYAMHHNPRYFADAEAFDPDRFSPERRENIPRYAYFPFGAGPRGCIGGHFATLEAVLILAMIYQRFRLECLPNQQVIPHPLITLRPKAGITVKIVAI